jgi:hypothetical protein
VRARSTPAYTDEPVPRGLLPDGPLGDRVLHLLAGYHPVPLSGYDVIDVIGQSAPQVWGALDVLVAEGVVLVTSGGQYLVSGGTA